MPDGDAGAFRPVQRFGIAFQLCRRGQGAGVRRVAQLGLGDEQPPQISDQPQEADQHNDT
ncbi:hypothetical protein D3C72_2261570 [compost metagenome]